MSPGAPAAAVRLGIAVATRHEARSLFPAATPYLQAPPGSPGALLDITGIGPGCAAAGARRLLDGGATALLSWGSAAGLDPSLQPGALLLPETVFVGAGRVAIDAAWHARVLQRLAAHMDVVTAPLAASEVILGSAAAKAGVRGATGAAAVDMESAALAAEAARSGVPFLVLRAVADPATEALPHCVTAAVDEEGQLRIAVLLGALLRRPWEATALLRLARWFGAAEHALQRAAGMQFPVLFDASPDALRPGAGR